MLDNLRESIHQYKLKQKLLANNAKLKIGKTPIFDIRNMCIALEWSRLVIIANYTVGIPIKVMYSITSLKF